MVLRGHSRRAAHRDDIAVLPGGAILPTGTTQRAEWNYRPLVGRVLRRRHGLVVRLLEERAARRLLQLGYGSGSLLGVLGRHAEAVFGADVHAHAGAVRRVLASHGIAAELVRADAAALPFASSSLDCVVADSVLPYVADIEAACRELERVLLSDGWLVVVVPGDSRLLKAGARILTGVNPDDDLVTSPGDVLRTVQKRFRCERQLTTPARWVPLPRLYTALGLSRRSAVVVVEPSLRLPP